MTDTVTRRLSADGGQRVLSISRTYAADLDDVWSACTDAERIPRWLMPVTGDLRLHGRYQLEGNAGGVVEACDPPSHFRATWEYGGEVSWIDLHLTVGNDGTHVELTHTAPVDDAKWAEFGPGAVGVGWDLMGSTTRRRRGRRPTARRRPTSAEASVSGRAAGGTAGVARASAGRPGGRR